MHAIQGTVRFGTIRLSSVVLIFRWLPNILRDPLTSLSQENTTFSLIRSSFSSTSSSTSPSSSSSFFLNYCSSFLLLSFSLFFPPPLLFLLFSSSLSINSYGKSAWYWCTLRTPVRTIHSSVPNYSGPYCTGQSHVLKYSHFFMFNTLLLDLFEYIVLYYYMYFTKDCFYRYFRFYRIIIRHF